MRRVVALTVVSGLLFVLALPVCAHAEERLVSTDVQTVSGLELASQFVRGVSAFKIGRDVTTVTVDVDGTMVDMPVDYSAVIGSSGETGVGPVLLLAAGAGLLLRFLGLLIRLGR